MLSLHGRFKMLGLDKLGKVNEKRPVREFLNLLEPSKF
jgi:hypothetical protein